MRERMCWRDGRQVASAMPHRMECVCASENQECTPYNLGVELLTIWEFTPNNLGVELLEACDISGAPPEIA